MYRKLVLANSNPRQLAVVIAAIAQHQSALAMGNILGSCISNILGAFSLGLIFSPADLYFDKSSKIYTAVLLSLSSFFALYMLFGQILGRFAGGVLIATFIVYICSIACAIYKGIVTPPEEDDTDNDFESDSDSDSDSDSNSEIKDYTTLDVRKPPHRSQHPHTNSGISQLHLSATELTSPGSPPPAGASSTFHSPRSSNNSTHRSANPRPPKQPRSRSTTHHILHLTISILSLSLSGYILSHSTTSLATTLSAPPSLLGATLLSFATTLPEKLVAVFCGARSQSGVLVASTAGSNVFLLTLCAGVLFLAGDWESLQGGVGGVTGLEVGWMWGCCVLFAVVVMVGGKRWMGWGLLVLYIAFIACEFTLERR